MTRIIRIITNFSLLMPILLALVVTTILVWSWEAVYDEDMRGIWTGKKWMWET